MGDIYETRLQKFGRLILRQDEVVELPLQDNSRKEDVKFYMENGYLVLPKVFPKLEIRELYQVAQDLFKSPTKDCYVNKEPSKNQIRSLLNVHKIDYFSDISSTVREYIVKEFLGETYIHQSRINYKKGRGANGWHWHSDFETWHAQDGMPRMKCLTAMIPLEENDSSNGPLQVISKSHQVYCSTPKGKTVSSPEENFSDQKEGVPSGKDIRRIKDLTQGEVLEVHCSPGDVVLFDCNILHGSQPMKEDRSRTNLFFVFNSVENKLQEPFSCNFRRPEAMAFRGTK